MALPHVCLTYVLDTKLQGGKAIQKWQMRSNLGPSPNHSHLVSLIFNLHTGHKSPQYHIKHDIFFKQ